MVTYRVQDVTPDLHERLVKYYTTEFLNDETICKHLNWTQDEVEYQLKLFVLHEIELLCQVTW